MDCDDNMAQMFQQKCKMWLIHLHNFYVEGCNNTVGMALALRTNIKISLHIQSRVEKRKKNDP